MTPHETGSTATPADARAAAPLTRTFGPQGPTLGDLNLLTSKWVEVSEPAQLARCLQPICHRVTTID